ncbi:MAG: radical SAM protein [Actinomycetota bacterium]
MRVLLVSENRCRDNLVPYPLGPAHVAAALRDAGHEVAGLDLMFSEDVRGDVRRAVGDLDPECVGISIRNIDNQDSAHPVLFVEGAREVVEAVRDSTAAPVVLGGAGFTIFPAECLEYLGVELGIVGEGEEAFPAMLECLSRGEDPSRLAGAAVRRGGSVVVNRPSTYPDLRRLPGADHRVFDVSPYDWDPPGYPFLANAESRRGCHMECIYCPNPFIEGKRVRCRETADVVAELEDLASRGVRSLMFADSLFNHPDAYAMELCELIEERGPGLRWLCSFNPFHHEPGLFEAMRRAGCITLSVGNESGSQDILAALRKGFSARDVRETVTEARNAGLRVNMFLLLGGPGETRDTVEESLEFVRGLEPDMVTVTAGIRIYPGCELRRIAAEEGVIEVGQNLLRPAFYLSPRTRDWLYDYARQVCDGTPGWVM